MTTPTTGAAELPEALRLADSYAKAHAMYVMEDLYGTSKSYTAELLADRHATRAKLETELRRLHAQVEALSAAQAGVREPLSDERILYIRRVLLPMSAGDIEFARAVEFAHGIGEDDLPQPSPSPAPAQPVQDLQSVNDAVTIDLLNERVAYLEAELAKATAPAQPGQEGESRYRDRCTLGGRCLGGCLSREPCYLAARTAPQPATGAEPFGWVKSSEIESSQAFGGSINLWRRKYDCDTPVYLTPQPATADAAVRKVLAMFPFNVPMQAFSINGGPNLTADGDTEFYSAKRVLAFLTEVKTTLDAALAAQREVKP